MKNKDANGKSSTLRRILPVLALLAGLAPVVAHASEWDCQDCLNTAQEMYESYAQSCNWVPYEQYYSCMAAAQQDYNWRVGQCWLYVCPGT